MRFPVSWLLIAGLFFSCLPHTTAAAVDVTACGQVVPARQTGVLQADLAGCFWGVVLKPGAKLELNGHSVSGLPDFSDLVVCETNCTVSGPGDLSDTFDAVIAGVLGAGHRPAKHGVLTIRNVRVHDAKFALSAGSAVRASNVEIAHSGRAFVAPRIVGTDVAITDSLPGETIGDGRVRLVRLVLVGGSTLGISAVSLRLVDSYVMGNDDGYPGIDILTMHRPRVIRSTCGRSARLARDGVPVGTWRICMEDASS